MILITHPKYQLVILPDEDKHPERQVVVSDSHMALLEYAALMLPEATWCGNPEPHIPLYDGGPNLMGVFDTTHGNRRSMGYLFSGADTCSNPPIVILEEVHMPQPRCIRVTISGTAILPT
jgi:hypothetical protein